MEPRNSTARCGLLLREFRYDFELFLPEFQNGQLLQMRPSLYEPWRAEEAVRSGGFSPEISPWKLTTPGRFGAVVEGCPRARIAWCVWHVASELGCGAEFLHGLNTHRGEAGIWSSFSMKPGVPGGTICSPMVGRKCSGIAKVIADLPPYEVTKASNAAVFSAIARLEVMVSEAGRHMPSFNPYGLRRLPAAVRVLLERALFQVPSPFSELLACPALRALGRGARLGQGT